MNVDIKDIGNGWSEIGIGVTSSDIHALIAGLTALEQRRDHFHIRSDFSGEPGIGDIEIYWVEEDSSRNMTVDTSPPIKPTS